MVSYPLLVVEAEHDGQDSVARLLRQVDLEVEGAGTAEDAWRLLNERPFAGGIIDLTFHCEDNLQLMTNIRSSQHLRTLPCIAITAFHTPELRQQCVQTGFDAYYPKPLNRIVFLQSVEDLMLK